MMILEWNDKVWNVDPKFGEIVNSSDESETILFEELPNEPQQQCYDMAAAWHDHLSEISMASTTDEDEDDEYITLCTECGEPYEPTANDMRCSNCGEHQRLGGG